MYCLAAGLVFFVPEVLFVRPRLAELVDLLFEICIELVVVVCAVHVTRDLGLHFLDLSESQEVLLAVAQLGEFLLLQELVFPEKDRLLSLSHGVVFLLLCFGFGVKLCLKNVFVE